MTASELQLSEKYVQSIVAEAKRLYQRKYDRLVYCDLWIGRGLISDPETFYKSYFEEKDAEESNKTYRIR